MAYQKQTVLTGDLITADWGNYIQTQYDAVKSELGNRAGELWAQIKAADGAGSGLDADLVRGRNVAEDLDNLAYDLYLLWLEQYYLGEVAGGPSPSGARAIAFDGFVNTSYRDSSLTTAEIDTSARLVRPGRISDRLYGMSNPTFWEKFGRTGPPSNLPYVTDHNDSTYAEFSASYSSSEDLPQWALTYDLGTAKRICRLRFSGYISVGTVADLTMVVEGSNDNATWTAIASEFYDEDGSAQKTFDKTCDVTYRYLKYRLNCGETFAESYTGTARWYSCEAYWFGQTQFVSATKSLLFTSKRVKLYLSAKIPSGTSIQPYISFDNGATWISAGSPVASRADPKFSGYTEYEYEVTSATGGSQVKLKVVLTPSDSDYPELKRYGMHIFEV